MFDTTTAEFSYFYGLASADGNLYQGPGQKGKFSIEQKTTNSAILHELADFLRPITACAVRPRKVRKTNFGTVSAEVLNVSGLAFRNFMKGLGYPTGRKDMGMPAPEFKHSSIDFVRGYIDGNGSIGITAKDIPFISVFMRSESLRNYFAKFLVEVMNYAIGTNRNIRDNGYNICIYGKFARELVSILYYPDCMAAPAKFCSALKLI
jgi:hypothetical protein